MRFSALVVFSVILAPAAAAQSVAGRVTDRASSEVIAGVVVSGLDSSRAVIARTVTDRASGYRLTLVPGIVRLQFRRIGYAPVEVALRDSVGGRIDATMIR